MWVVQMHRHTLAMEDKGGEKSLWTYVPLVCLIPHISTVGAVVQNIKGADSDNHDTQ